MLQGCVQAIDRSTRRPYDTAARYGGEEFAVVPPNANSVGAKQVAQTIKRQVAQLSIAHIDSPAGDVVTLSLGVATTIPAPSAAPESMTARAD